MFPFPCLQFALAEFAAVWDDQAGAPVAPSAMTVVLPTAAFAPDRSHALQSLRLPGNGLPTGATSRVSVSMTTWWFVEYR